MKLVRYGPHGHERPGIVDSAGVVRDLSGHIADIDDDTFALETLERLARLDPARLPAARHDRLGPCLSRVGKIVGVGLNYRSHALEAAMDLPDEPLLFLKPASAISGAYDPVTLPSFATTADYEIELGVVIGLTATRVDQAHALQHVAGYCIVNDITERTWQLHRGGTWDKGKAHDTFAPIGPWLVTADEIGDPHDLAMHLAVDAETRQQANTNDMHHRIDELITYITQFMTLHPGDIITTGTPAGTALGTRGENYLRPGQLVTATIDGLGTQRTPIVQVP
ncbi:MAG: 2,4-didehydro-3-deoxy-L-rhamnonate hydrolase [Ilumatobacteraceae bacterium]